MTLGVATVGATAAAYATFDPDIYWHRILGENWIESRRVHIAQDPIAFTAGVRDWVPTSWAAEILYATVVRVGGYAALSYLHLMLVLAFYGALAAYLHRSFTPVTAVLAMAVVGVPAAFSLQHRPQTLSLLFIALALPAVHRYLHQPRHLPGVLAASAVTWSWANVHGLWILVPALYLLESLVSLRRGRRSLHALAAAMLCVVAAAMTPVGPRLLLSPFLVRSSASEISEWQPTQLTNPVAWGLGASLLLLLLAWGRAGVIPGRQRVFAVSAIVFGLMAFRNANVAALLLLPLTGRALQDITHKLHTRAVLPRPALVAASVLVCAWLTSVFGTQPVPPDTMPAAIAGELRQQQGQVRLVAPYNISGYLREFGGHDVRVAIDGRADRYGSQVIKRYNDMMEGRRGWAQRLSSLDPDAVVARQDSALRELLLADGWRQTLRDADYVLLARP